MTLTNIKNTRPKDLILIFSDVLRNESLIRRIHELPIRVVENVKPSEILF